MTTTRRRRIRRIVALAAAAVLLLFFLDALGCRRLSGTDFPVRTPLATSLRKHVETLASNDWGGRVPGTPGNDAAASYLEAALRDNGFAPHPRIGSFRTPVGPGDNVIGYLPADIPVTRRDRDTDRDGDGNGDVDVDVDDGGDGNEAPAIVLGAHFDHLGNTGESRGIMLGADDNASSVAVLLGALPMLRDRKERTHPIVVAFFNTEEMPYFRTAKQGSRRLVDQLGWTSNDVDLAVVLDLIGGVVWRTTAETFFACGAEKTAGLSEIVDQVAVPGVAANQLGIHMVENIPGYRPTPFSDYDVFRERRIPFLFLSSGRTPRYHASSDTPETLHYERMALTSRWIAELVAAVDQRPASRPGAPARFSFDAERIDLARDIATLRPLLHTAANPFRSVPGTSPITAIRLLSDVSRVDDLAAKQDGFRHGDVLAVERAGFRLQCLLYSYPVCFTL